jgi:hypothetical protein
MFAQPARPEGPAVEARVLRVINEYAEQGFHRTGTDVDRASGDWLFEEVRRAGLTPTREPFTLDRVTPLRSQLIAGVEGSGGSGGPGGRRFEGVPLFDGAFTDANGVSGRLGPLESDAEIGLTETAPNAAAAGALGDARRQNRHRAIVCITRGSRPGLCPSNADLFVRPFGPPVLQLSSEEGPWLAGHARRGSDVQVIAHATRSRASSFNVTATIRGADSTRPPIVVMTPRSGWYWCASERGGGIASWLELMRALRTSRPSRGVVFVASSGHELGHLGINAFVANRPGIVKDSAGWIHLGANIGAATEPGNTIQASDDEFETLLRGAMASGGLGVDRRIPRGAVPNGEAEVVHRGGGRYLSVIGRNALFHNPDDRGPQTVNPDAIAGFARALTAVAERLAGS